MKVSRSLTLLSVLLPGLLEPTAAAQEIAVIPAGSGPGLGPTAAVGRAIVKIANKGRRRRAKLVYVLPDLPAENPRLGRKAGKLMSAAARAFQMMEYGKAVELAEKAEKIYKDVAKSGKLEGYVESQHLIAASAFFDGQMARAKGAMNDAYLADPRPPPAKRFSPQVQDLYNQVVSEPPAHGAVRLGSAPPGALVWFHHKLVGPAAGTIRLRAGLYLVRAYLPGHGVYQRWFRVQAHKTRDLMIPLKQDKTAEAETMVQLRAESAEAEPGATLNQVALNVGASQVILLTSGDNCTPQQCRINMGWTKEAKWHRMGQAVYQPGGARRAALALVGRKRPTVARRTNRRTENPLAPIVPPGARACSLDSDCGFREQCIRGQCGSVTPFYQKWWFWTLIGVGVAGATVGIVLPLTRPDAPVISVE